MRTKYLSIFCGAAWLEGMVALAALKVMNFTTGRGGIFNYSLLRWVFGGGFALFLLALAGFLITLAVRGQWGEIVCKWMDRRLLGEKKRLFFVQGMFLLLVVFLGECFMLTYLAFPEPARPLFFWAAVICLEGWVALRIAYAGEYRQRPGLRERLAARWRSWLPEQRKVATVIAALACLYFASFIPFNLLRDPAGNFFVHQDEQVVYPEVTQEMVFAPSFSGFAHGALESWGWQYGYPYFTASALALLVPRLIFGSHFATHIQLNIFLLRQLVDVLPMTLALVLMVYMATRFKNMLLSVSAFVFMGLMPGIVKYNYRFYHPDALIVLLVVLGIYALQKDDLRFGKYFYLAAACCGVAAIMKLWGLFFGPVIAGYLIAGFLKKRLTFGKMVLSGGLFLLAMLAAVVISTPTIMAPYIARVALRSWLPRQGTLLNGYNVPDPTGDYRTGLVNWLRFFGAQYMKDYYFYFSFFALLAGSLFGPRQALQGILLGWCTVVAIFLAYFVALKNLQYMLPVAVPLASAAFFFPGITETGGSSRTAVFLARPAIKKVLRGFTVAMVGSQFVINLVILVLFAVRGH